MAAPTASELLTLADNTISAATAYIASLPPNNASQQYITAQQFLNYVQLIRDNIARGEFSRVLILQGGDLCEIAAQYYGDASLGFALAAANVLIGPNLSDEVIYQISLPPLSALEN